MQINPKNIELAQESLAAYMAEFKAAVKGSNAIRRMGAARLKSMSSMEIRTYGLTGRSVAMGWWFARLQRENLYCASGIIDAYKERHQGFYKEEAEQFRSILEDEIESACDDFEYHIQEYQDALKEAKRLSRKKNVTTEDLERLKISHLETLPIVLTRPFDWLSENRASMV